MDNPAVVAPTFPQTLVFPAQEAPATRVKLLSYARSMPYE